MATIAQIRKELAKKIEAARPKVKQKLTTDGYFGLEYTLRGQTQDLPFRDYTIVVSSRTF